MSVDVELLMHVDVTQSCFWELRHMTGLCIAIGVYKKHLDDCFFAKLVPLLYSINRYHTSIYRHYISVNSFHSSIKSSKNITVKKLVATNVKNSSL